MRTATVDLAALSACATLLGTRAVRAGWRARRLLKIGRRVLSVARRIACGLTILALLGAALLAWLAPAAPVEAAMGGTTPASLESEPPGRGARALPSAAVSADASSFVPGGTPAVAGPSSPLVDSPVLQQPVPLPRIWPIGPINAGPIKELVVSLAKGALDDVNAALRVPLQDFLNDPLNVISQTPPEGSYDNRVVTDLWNVVRRAALALLGVIVTIGGLNVLLKDRIGAPYHEAAEFLARVPLGAALASASLWLVQLPIDLNNALCGLVGGTAMTAWLDAPAGVQTFASLIAGLLYLIFALCLLLQMVLRLALIDVLIVVAPLALVCWVLPQTQGWARQWTSTFTAAVFVQFVQVVTLKLGTALFVDLTPQSSVAGALLPSILGIATLVLTLRIPDIMRSAGGGGFGIARLIVYTRVAGAVRGR